MEKSYVCILIASLAIRLREHCNISHEIDRRELDKCSVKRHRRRCIGHACGIPFTSYSFQEWPCDGLLTAKERGGDLKETWQDTGRAGDEGSRLQCRPSNEVCTGQAERSCLPRGSAAELLPRNHCIQLNIRHHLNLSECLITTLLSVHC